MPTDPIDDTLAAPDTAGASGAHHAVLDRRYEILGLLGSGGMGNVYKARDLELDELIALKESSVPSWSVRPERLTAFVVR